MIERNTLNENENENPIENGETVDKPTAIEDDKSDTDSIRNVELSTLESTEREENKEDDEIIEINGDEYDLEKGITLSKTSKSTEL